MWLGRRPSRGNHICKGMMYWGAPQDGRKGIEVGMPVSNAEGPGWYHSGNLSCVGQEDKHLPSPVEDWEGTPWVLSYKPN